VQEILLTEPERPQVLTVTQRPEVLDVLDLRADRVRLFLVRRDKAGATTVRRIGYGDGLARHVERGQTLSSLWLSAALDGTPHR
jgi:hypothetical protein